LSFLVSAAVAQLPKPDLDLPVNSPTIEALRRVQTRTGTLYQVQRFPQGTRSLAAFAASGDASDFDRTFLSEWLPGARQEFLQWHDTVRENSFFLSPAIETEYQQTLGDSDNISGKGGLGLFIYGKVSPRLTYYTHGMVYTEKTNRAQFGHQFSPQYGETYTVEKGAGDSLLADRTFNRFENYLLLDLSWLTLKFGRDRVRMGPGYFSSLMAKGDTPPYFLLEGRVGFSDWLDIDTYLLKMTDTDHAIQKYANLHRFEFKPLPSLSVAFQDIVIYQDRDPDPIYILPLAPLTFSEANYGGRDNAAMGFDFTYAPVKNLNLWGELFIDDLLGPSTFFDSFWENRWASLAGFQVTSPFPLVDADLVVEYSHVEPWTYNGRQPETSFRQFDVPSASKLGPDSRSLDMRIAYRPWKTLEWKEHWERDEKGRGRGATLGTVHDDAIDGQTKEFLADGTQRIALTHEFTARFRRFALFGFAWRNEWVGGFRNTFSMGSSIVF